MGQLNSESVKVASGSSKVEANISTSSSKDSSTSKYSSKASSSATLNTIATYFPSTGGGEYTGGRSHIWCLHPGKDGLVVCVRIVLARIVLVSIVLVRIYCRGGTRGLCSGSSGGGGHAGGYDGLCSGSCGGGRHGGSSGP